MKDKTTRWNKDETTEQQGKKNTHTTTTTTQPQKATPTK